MADAEGDEKPSAEEQLREKLRDTKVKFLEAAKVCRTLLVCAARYPVATAAIADSHLASHQPWRGWDDVISYT